MHPKPSTKFIPLLLLFLHLHPALLAQNSIGGQFPRLEPDPRALEYSGRGARGYSWEDLAEIGLWASGGNTSPYLEQIRAATDAIRRAPELPATDRAKGEFILEYMHKNILKSYSLYQSGLDTLLATGRYNCVSSAVLYMVLCKSSGLDVSGVITRDHAFALLHSGGESIDVETTNPNGFDPGSRREFHDEFGRLTGFAYVPARNYRDRQTISPIELISLIISNRISELEMRSRFSEAIPLAVDRAALLSGIAPDVSASGPLFGNPENDLVERLLNYGASLLNSGREEDCLRWAVFASARYPPERNSDEERWQEHIMAAVNNRIVKYTRAGNNTEARVFLDAQKSALSAINYAELDAVLLDTELLERANRIRGAADGDAVIAAINEARLNGRIVGGRASELYTFAVQKTASVLSTAPGRDWLAAVSFIESAISRFGTNRELDQALRTYRTNVAADFHNRFAAAWNRRNYDEARRILDEGLAEFPGDRQLLSDKEIVDRYRP
jgi:tetratricopeptide (TPR) repeat protein